MWVGKSKSCKKQSATGLHMLYLKLPRNQGQEWSSVTVSSLAKKLVGVNDIVIENVELEATSAGEQIVIRARPRKNAQCRCGICGRKCSRFDHGKGLRRWRAPDLGAGTMNFIEAEAPRVNCPEHGVVVQQVPWARHKSRFTRSFEDTAVWLPEWSKNCPQDGAGLTGW